MISHPSQHLQKNSIALCTTPICIQSTSLVYWGQGLLFRAKRQRIRNSESRRNLEHFQKKTGHPVVLMSTLLIGRPCVRNTPQSSRELLQNPRQTIRTLEIRKSCQKSTGNEGRAHGVFCQCDNSTRQIHLRHRSWVQRTGRIFLPPPFPLPHPYSPPTSPATPPPSTPPRFPPLPSTPPSPTAPAPAPPPTPQTLPFPSPAPTPPPLTLLASHTPFRLPLLSTLLNAFPPLPPSLSLQSKISPSSSLPASTAAHVLWSR